jgi:hypothetical protein
MTRELYQRESRLLDELNNLQQDIGAVEVIRDSDSAMLLLSLRKTLRERIRDRRRKIEEEFAAL